MSRNRGSGSRRPPALTRGAGPVGGFLRFFSLGAAPGRQIHIADGMPMGIAAVGFESQRLMRWRMRYSIRTLEIFLHMAETDLPRAWGPSVPGAPIQGRNNPYEHSLLFFITLIIFDFLEFRM